MSLLLLRPRSLPTLHVKASKLIQIDVTNPMTIFEVMAMEMIPVHDKILDLALETAAERSVTALKNDVAWLRTEMSRIHKVMTEV